MLGIVEATFELEREDAIRPLTTPLPLRRLISPTRRHQSGRGFHHQMPKSPEYKGPHIPDWRMCMGEWEIRANGFHEEGLRGNDRTMVIPRSEGWNSFTESVAATVESRLSSGQS